MTRTSGVLAAATVLAAAVLSAQAPVPEIPFQSVGTPDLLKFPENVHMGEAAGVATNSKGDIFLYTRTGNPSVTLGTSRAVSHGGSRLFQFDRNGKFVREIGQGSYGMQQAQQVRVDAGDNVWIVDQMSTQVIKFDSNGRVQMVLSRKPEAMRVPALPLTPPATGVPVVQKAAEGPAAPPGAGAPPAGGGRGGALPGAGAEGESFQRPTDVAWDKAGNIYVADGYGNARIAKYDPNGKYIKSWGSRGSAQGQFDIVHGIAIDAQGTVYVADEGNKRIQTFDGDGNFKTQFTSIGTPTAICITPSQPQFIYVAHTGDPDGMEDAAIYKMALDGKVVGKFGSAGKEIKQFGLVNSIDCRNENELLVGELSNWRVQKLTLKTGR
ncbi:MAG TPA: peptidyl-alpha-hydroxyglycine alpha-amidating lyase family protein [Vicinamibacterales bacterium]|nr:peptidyl-alpha-hydroxyglycine alpha-amidating lyase family protein [Vicinamibacterales bacterium]